MRMHLSVQYATSPNWCGYAAAPLGSLRSNVQGSGFQAIMVSMPGLYIMHLQSTLA